MKIALIIPYFGKFRNDNDFWLKSIELNPTIDILIFTDQQIKVPENVKLIAMSFIDFRRLIQSKFDFDVSIPQPYKICDFRPAYGYILSDYLSGYDFWGHCDNDLIFGNIRKFIPDSILNSYDKILRRGHFTLYRNKPETNDFFKK